MPPLHPTPTPRFPTLWIQTPTYSPLFNIIMKWRRCKVPGPALLSAKVLPVFQSVALTIIIYIIFNSPLPLHCTLLVLLNFFGRGKKKQATAACHATPWSQPCKRHLFSTLSLHTCCQLSHHVTGACALQLSDLFFFYPLPEPFCTSVYSKIMFSRCWSFSIQPCLLN